MFRPNDKLIVSKDVQFAEKGESQPSHEIHKPKVVAFEFKKLENECVKNDFEMVENMNTGEPHVHPSVLSSTTENSTRHEE